MNRRFLCAFLVFAMVISLLVGIIGCKKETPTSDNADTGTNIPKDENEDQKASDQTEPAKKVKLSWGFQRSDYGPDKSNWPTEIFKDFCKTVNTELEFIGWPDDQMLQLALASGDLPDIIMIHKDWVNQTLEGNLMLPMDDYLSVAPNLQALSQLRLEAMREYYSNGDGKLYFWTPQVGNESLGTEMWNGLTIRWDYYKEIGAPEVKNEDDFLNVVKQILDKHPTTEDGQKVFGLGTFSDMGMWGWWIRGCMYGYHNITDAYMLRVSDNEVISNYLDLDSPTWRDIRYYWKANQMGIFDPDSFTMKATDYSAKAGAGQYVAVNCSWYGGSLYRNMREQDPDTLAKFMVLPVEGQYNWANSSTQIGWSFYYGLTKNCRDPERAMQIFDFLNTPEGARLAYSGTQGKHWDYIDGKPQILPEVIEMRNKGGDEWAVFGSGLWDGLIGLPHMSLHPDGGYVDLWYDRSLILPNLDPVQKDYASHYGVEIPSDAQMKLIKEGKAFDKSGMMGDMISLLPSAPQEIRRIDTKCDEIMMKAIPNLVLAKDRIQFNEERDAVIEDLKAAGIEKSIDWWQSQAKEVKAFIESNS